MTALILCTSKVLLQNSLAEWRDATGGDAILFSGMGNPETQVAQQAIGRGAFREAQFFADYEKSDLIEKAALELMANGFNISTVLSFSEVDVLRAARVRKKLGIIGQDSDDAAFFRDKTLMKRRAWERGIEVPKFARISCPADLVEFISANGFPVVTKPYDGRGSADVCVLQSDDDVDAFLTDGTATAGNYTVEEFIEGDMYRVDGLYVSGVPVVMHVGRYLKDCLAFIRGETIGTHGLDQKNPVLGRIEAFTRHLLGKALPFPSTSIFHVQLFHTPDDRLVLCEVASRLGGGVINEEVRFATGIDIKMDYVKRSMLQAKAPVSLPYEVVKPTARIIIPPRQGTLQKFPVSCDFEWVNLYKAYGIAGQRYGGASMTNAEVAGFVFQGENEEHLRQRAVALETWFNANSEWSS